MSSFVELHKLNSEGDWKSWSRLFREQVKVLAKKIRKLLRVRKALPEPKSRYSFPVNLSLKGCLKVNSPGSTRTESRAGALFAGEFRLMIAQRRSLSHLIRSNSLEINKAMSCRYAVRMRG